MKYNNSLNYLKVSVCIFIILIMSRIIPHPPNFTSLIALTFYLSVFFGLKFLPIVILSFLFTDLLIGLHNTILFTYGSIIIIGYLAKFFKITITQRIFGSLSGAILFFLITNFGVWTTGLYDYNLIGFISCFTLAIPFFSHTIISTLFYSILVEAIYFLYKNKFKLS